jgi:hypothetical protein
MHISGYTTDSSCKAISCFFSVLRQFKFVKPTRQPGEKNKQALKNKVIFACYVDVKQQKLPSISFIITEILNKEYKYKIIA